MAAFAAAAFVLVIALSPSSAADETAVDPVVVPAEITAGVVTKRQDFFLKGSQPLLTNDLLAAYVERRQALKDFDGFDVAPEPAVLTEDVMLSYIAKRRNDALQAIEDADVTAEPALTSAALLAYAADYQPTSRKVKLADDEKLCLTQAIYHEARGESREGQLAVANVIINRAMSKRYPSTICGVVFQNADKGRYKCQFTFACDGRSDMGTERGAWNRSMALAEEAFHNYQRGERPGVIPNGALFYHTTAVAPNWSHSFKRVAAIGSHIFYTPN